MAQQNYLSESVTLLSSSVAVNLKSVPHLLKENLVQWFCQNVSYLLCRTHKFQAVFSFLDVIPNEMARFLDMLGATLEDKILGHLDADLLVAEYADRTSNR